MEFEWHVFLAPYFSPCSVGSGVNKVPVDPTALGGITVPGVPQKNRIFLWFLCTLLPSSERRQHYGSLLKGCGNNYSND